MTVKDRLKLFCKESGMPISVFEKSINVSNGYINSISKGLGIDILNTIIEKYSNLNIEWVLSGKGNMLKTSHEDSKLSSLEVVKSHKPKYIEKKEDVQDIPLFNFKASAGIKEILGPSSNDFLIDTIRIPDMPKCDGAIKIMGDSMMPKLKPGDIIMYKEMPLNIQDLFYGEMYLVSYEIDGDYYVVVKYIRKSEKGEPFIKLVSENPEHASKDIEFGRINALALIKGYINVSTMG
nr:MAG TPA: putative transcriptional regulator [Caudoviricetes sp.]